MKPVSNYLIHRTNATLPLPPLVILVSVFAVSSRPKPGAQKCKIQFNNSKAGILPTFHIVWILFILSGDKDIRRRCKTLLKSMIRALPLIDSYHLNGFNTVRYQRRAFKNKTRINLYELRTSFYFFKCMFTFGNSTHTYNRDFSLKTFH